MDSPVPFKKPRLDYCNKNISAENSRNSDVLPGKDNIGNELWGDDDFTAEEFDLLQSQVSSQIIPNTKTNCIFENKSDELKKLKEQNYALEGQIKMLRSTLEQNLKDLDKERLEKMSLIESYYDQQKEQQKSFNKIKEQLETQLNFKDHELRTTLEKLTILQQKGKNSAKISPMKCTENFLVADISKIHFNKCFIINYLMLSHCLSLNNLTENISKISKNSSDDNIETSEKENCYKLKLESKIEYSKMKFLTFNSLFEDEYFSLFTINEYKNGGKKKQENNILSGQDEDIFLNSMPSYLKTNKNNLLNLFLTELSLNTQDYNLREESFPIESLPSFKIVLLLEESLKKSSEILNNLIKEGKNFAQSLMLPFSNNNNFPYTENFSMTFFIKNVENRIVRILQCICELIDFDNFRNILINYTSENPNQDIKMSSNNIANKDEILLEENIHPLIYSVLNSSTPLYYENNCINISVVEWCLMVLIKLAEYDSKKFDNYLHHINLCLLISGKCSFLSSSLILKLLQQILPLKTLRIICRHSELCIYKSLCELCQMVRKKDLCPSSFKTMIEVLHFISGMVSSHGTLSDNMNECTCLQELFEEIMKILNEYIKNYINKQTKNIHFIEKGMSLLNILISHFSRFEEQFANSQPVYVSLWNEGLSQEFKNLYLK